MNYFLDQKLSRSAVYSTATACGPSAMERCPKQAVGTKNAKNCFALNDFYGENVKQLEWFLQSYYLGHTACFPSNL